MSSNFILPTPITLSTFLLASWPLCTLLRYSLNSIKKKHYRLHPDLHKCISYCPSYTLDSYPASQSENIVVNCVFEVEPGMVKYGEEEQTTGARKALMNWSCQKTPPPILSEFSASGSLKRILKFLKPLHPTDPLSIIFC